MAELLIKAVSATHPDPVKQARGCYQQGDPVVVMPDGHEWGAAEGLPTFWIVKAPGVTVAEARAYIEQRADAVRRRNWNLNPADLPVALRDELLATGSITLTRAQAIAAVKAK